MGITSGDAASMIKGSHRTKFTMCFQKKKKKNQTKQNNLKKKDVENDAEFKCFVSIFNQD